MTLPMKFLCDYTAGRDNNFNLLRLVAATLVLISHSYALSTGDLTQEPLYHSLGVKLGTLAVDVFFIASGFLVAGSLVKRQSLRDFFAARALRIYPGLWAALLISTLAVATFFTTESFNSFFLQKETWKYLLKNGILVTDVAFSLPGAFPGVPFEAFAKHSVNGSLWTLPKEIHMYAILAGLWWVISRLKPSDTVKSLRMFVLVVVGLSLVADIGFFLAHQDATYTGLLCRFFSGVALRLWHERVPTSPKLFFALLGGLLLSTLSPTAFGLTYRLVAPYLVMYLALVPGGWIRVFNRVGDYSYGIYIYAFPVQQAVAYVCKGVGPIMLTIWAFSVTFVLAMASWHLLEKHALKIKDRVMFPAK